MEVYMNNQLLEEAIELLKKSLEELEGSNGKIQSGVQKLLRASKMLNEKDIEVWCEIQLGNEKYTTHLKILIKKISEKIESAENNIEEVTGLIQKQKENNFNLDLHCSIHELEVKLKESGGGYNSIGFIEDKYSDLMRRKKGNDGTYYKNNLLIHLNYVRNKATDLATSLYNKYAFSEIAKTSFDILKDVVDDQLLEINPSLAEKLMVAFKRVSTDNHEEWSQALTTCRRFIEELADTLYPPSEEKINGRALGKAQYINRIWAFMDKAIESETNKKLAKSHVDFIGSYLQTIHKQSNKGVHDSLTRIEAVKAVFHTYLIVADILDYLEQDLAEKGIKELDIMEANLDELQSFLNIKKDTAKEIVKLRVRFGNVKKKDLQQIKGIGPKTLNLAAEIYGVN